MSGQRTIAVARKEFLHILRDYRSLTMALAVPLMMLLLFGYALTLDVDRIPTLVHDADNSPQSRDLIARFEGSRFFDIVSHVDNYQVIEDKIDKSEILVGLVFPNDYSQKLLAGQEADVQILIDGSDSNTASIALGYIDVILGSYSYEVRAREQEKKVGRQLKVPAEARLRVLYNSEMSSRNYIVPGLIAVILMIIAGMMTSLTIAREWESGTMEQVLSTPLRPAEMAIGKMLAYAAVGVTDTIVAVVIGVFLFDVPMRGSILLLGVSSGLFLLGALFWGILLSAATRSQLLAYQASMLSSFLPAYLLSGFIFAIETMPAPIQAFTYIVPARYFIKILMGVFLKGVGWKILLADLAFLVVFATIVMLITIRKLRQKVA